MWTKHYNGPKTKNPRTLRQRVNLDATKLVPVIEATGQPADGKTLFEKPWPGFISEH
ncbi:hypothetical protein CFter6_1739 [Collimonas fungivorans]|uniref:Uncharacterized protein n=1 Tax=Collimonas fungivorans TaxID=158899 RepID=A0A127P9E1_9BURK|nr:hypothetical protein [Collimonas fungivorans]AMO94439.1 hypothetical protein CFter6_1739 [Collimonas fungivorans]